MKKRGKERNRINRRDEEEENKGKGREIYDQQEKE